jgi:hypothetical protein
MRILVLLVLPVLILVLVSSQARACRPVFIPLEERVASAKGIYLGTVTGKTLTGLERRLRRDPQDLTIVVPEEFSLRIVVLDRMKGPRRTIVEVPILGCGSGSGDLNDRVVVFSDRSGSYYVADEQHVISDVRRLLEGGR